MASITFIFLAGKNYNHSYIHRAVSMATKHNVIKLNQIYHKILIHKQPDNCDCIPTLSLGMSYSTKLWQ